MCNSLLLLGSQTMISPPEMVALKHGRVTSMPVSSRNSRSAVSSAALSAATMPPFGTPRFDRLLPCARWETINTLPLCCSTTPARMSVVAGFLRDMRARVRCLWRSMQRNVITKNRFNFRAHCVLGWRGKQHCCKCIRPCRGSFSAQQCQVWRHPRVRQGATTLDQTAAR